MENCNRMKLPELKRLGKVRGLLGVDLNSKKELIKRLEKGIQLSDFNKNKLLEKAKNEGVLVNATMSKNILIQKLENPKPQDLSDARLRQIAKDEGIKLRVIMPRKAIIFRIETPTPYYTMDSLKRSAKANNIELRKGVNKTELLNILGERGIIKERREVEVSPLAVERQIKDLETIREIRKHPPTSKRIALQKYRSYISNIKKDNLSSIRLKEIVKTLEKKEKEAKEERNRIMTPREGQSAFKKFARVYIIEGDDSYRSSFEFLEDATDSIVSILRRNKETKVKLIFRCNMAKDDMEGGVKIAEFAFSSNIETNLEVTDENELYFQMIDLIEERVQKLDKAEGTGWYFHSVVQLELHTVNYKPLRGGSYIDLPQYIKAKKAVINIKNKDEKCFLWCVLRALNPTNKNHERIDRDLQSKVNTIDMGDIKFPVELKAINKFESLNSNITIHVYGYNENDKIYPLRISEDIDRPHKIDLLYISNEDTNHYCLIKHFERLVGSQISKHKERVHICRRCLNPFPKEESLKTHNEYCKTNDCIILKMPTKDNNKLSFKNHWKTERVPFIIYADTEALIKPIQNCESNPKNKYTRKYQKHEPISFSYYIKCSYRNDFLEPRTYTGIDAMQKFVEWIEQDVKNIANTPCVDIIFGEEEAVRFNKATNCWICEKELGED